MLISCCEGCCTEESRARSGAYSLLCSGAPSLPMNRLGFFDAGDCSVFYPPVDLSVFNNNLSNSCSKASGSYGGSTTAEKNSSTLRAWFIVFRESFLVNFFRRSICFLILASSMESKCKLSTRTEFFSFCNIFYIRLSSSFFTTCSSCFYCMMICLELLLLFYFERLDGRAED